ncbi:MAG: transketolase [Rhodospirillaceae bacterium]
MLRNSFDAVAAKRRCINHRRRILEVSQNVTALHVAPAFSCLEMVDALYYALMRRKPAGGYADAFLMSKGHGVIAQYVVLESLGLMPEKDILEYCTPAGRLGAHPDYGNPGIEASTGSLGHGLGIAAGMAYADKIQGVDRVTYVILGDGEMQEGSVWEAIMMSPNLKLCNLVAFCDFNEYQGLGRTQETHPHFLPLTEKAASFGWEAVEIDGQEPAAVVEAVRTRKGDRPLMITSRTTKGYGVSYMLDNPIWHYRSPNKEEYAQALAELAAMEKELG